MLKNYTDDELLAITQREIEKATSGEMLKISAEREKALYYYDGEAKGELAPHDTPGASTFVSSDVSDTVEWMLPSLMKIFTAGDDAVEFAPQNEEDGEAAQQATAYVNHIFYRKNPGWLVLYTWFKDALLQKNGFLKVYWDSTPTESIEQYTGLDEASIGLLIEDGAEIIGVEQVGEAPSLDVDEQGQPLPNVALYNVTARFIKSTGQVRVDNVPPEEFLIDPGARSIEDAVFVGHRVERTMSELRDAGYENLDNITDDTLDVFDNESVTRDDGFFTDDDENVEKRVKLTECYLKIDMDGSGIAEWRKIVRAGNAILENVEVESPPFVTITPIPVPHKFFGLSVADQAMAIQRVKTSIWRSNLEGLYRTINERTYAVQQNVNMDDLLTNRPGGVVRVKHPTDVGPLQTGRPDLSSGLAMLEQVTTAGENRTGWTRYSQGVGADSLNKTATGINIITNKSEMRVELIARVFAETGVKDLFRMILKLVSMYQDRAEVIKLTNKWVTIDPREWHNQFDFVINVGLGSGNRDQVAGQLMQILELQTQGMQLGLADAQKIYHTGAKLLENMGFKNPESFFIDPSQQQEGQAQQQEQPDPEMIKAQTEAQIKMQEFELKRWQAEQEIELKRERLIAEMNLKRQEMALKMGADAEQDLYHQYDQQNTGYLADGINPTAGNAATSGDEQIQPSQGDIGQSPMGADIQDPSGGLPQSMGEQQII